MNYERFVRLIVMQKCKANLKERMTKRFNEVQNANLMVQPET